MSEKITIVLSIWILFIFIITGDANLEIFFILIFIGILIVRELTDIFTTSDLKDISNLCMQRGTICNYSAIRLFDRAGGGYERIAHQCILNGIKNTISILLCSGYVSANGSESLCTFHSSERTRHLLFHFYHA